MSLTPSQKEYALHFASMSLGCRMTADEVDLDICHMICEALNRKEEIANTARDQWGCWDWQYSDSQRRGELYVPWLDRLLIGLKERIQMRHPDRQGEPLWPDNKPFAVCLTHDVDVVISHLDFRTMLSTIYNDFQLSLNGRLRANRARWFMRNWINQLQTHVSFPVRNFEEWLKLESSVGFKSTFYFFPSRLLHRHAYDCTYQFHDLVQHRATTMAVSEMMHDLDRAGWEIGLHGSYHSAREPGLLVHERQQLEEILGHSVISTRQHWLHYDAAATPVLQAEAGLENDSTQGFNRSIGFRAGTAFPYWCWNHQSDRPLPVLEIPQHIMDGGLFTANALEYDEDLAIQHSIQIMDEVERVGGCLTLSWHPHNVDKPKYWNVYKTLIEEAANRNAWGCSAGDLYKWWTNRERRLFEPEILGDPHLRTVCHSPVLDQ